MAQRLLNDESLKSALQGFEDFAAVHHGKEDYLEALNVLRHSLGLTDDRLAYFQDRLKDILGEEADITFLGAAFLGLLIGLIVRDHAPEVNTNAES